MSSTQYRAFVLPFLGLATIVGYWRLAARRPGHWPVAILDMAFALSLLSSPLAVARWWPRSEKSAAYQVLAKVRPRPRCLPRIATSPT